ncbi:unnamed protein product [Leuciscus chuanchicus]
MKGESKREERASPLQRVFQHSLLQIRPHAAFSISTGKHTHTHTNTYTSTRKRLAMFCVLPIY